MIDEQAQALINGELDGRNSGLESAQAREIMSSDPEARQLYDDLLQLSSLLSRVDRVEPPSDLRPRILRELRRLRNTPARSASWWTAIRERMMARPLRPAYAFSGGLALGVVAALIIAGFLAKENSLDLSRLYGTLSSRIPAPASSPESSLNIATSGISGTVSVIPSGPLMLVSVDVRSTRNVDLVLEYNGASLGFVGIKKMKDNSDSLRIGKNLLSLPINGARSDMLAFEQRGPAVSPLAVRIVVGDSTLFEGVLR